MPLLSSPRSLLLVPRRVRDRDFPEVLSQIPDDPRRPVVARCQKETIASSARCHNPFCVSCSSPPSSSSSPLSSSHTVVARRGTVERGDDESELGLVHLSSVHRRILRSLSGLPGRRQRPRFLAYNILVERRATARRALAVRRDLWKIETTLPSPPPLLLSPFLSLFFPQASFPVLSQSSRVHAGRASRPIGEVGSRRASPAVSNGVGHP